MKIKSITEKVNNRQKLTKEEIEYVVNNYTNGSINDQEMSLFLLEVKKNGLSYEETFYLTEAMVNSGEILDLSDIEKTIVDKHSTGGIGDKVTFIIAPIVASCGLGVAKMSGRSLGFTGGTIDKLESIEGYKINLSQEEFKTLVNNHGISIISANKNLAPADKKIYALRDVIGAVDSIPLIASSIMSKKIASGAKYIVIDLKVGECAFMKNEKDAKTLAKYMIKIGEYYKRKVICILTDMNTPLGYTVGNSIEVKEVIDFFEGKREKRLETVVTEIAAHMLMLGKNMSINDAKKEVYLSLNKGLAKEKFYEWIKSQGGDINSVKVAKNKLTIYAKQTGYITYIDSLKLSTLLFNLGAGRIKKEDQIDLNVGIELVHLLNEKVTENEPLMHIYYNNNESSNVEKIANEIIKIESILKKEKDIIIDIIK